MFVGRSGYQRGRWQPGLLVKSLKGASGTSTLVAPYFLPMPREIKKYLCEFRCGKKAQSTLQQIKAHESVCWKNPERKSCLTCKHESYEIHGDGYRTWAERSCKLLGYDKFESLLSSCKYHTKPSFHIHPVCNCTYWEEKAVEQKGHRHG